MSNLHKLTKLTIGDLDQVKGGVIRFNGFYCKGKGSVSGGKFKGGGACGLKFKFGF